MEKYVFYVKGKNTRVLVKNQLSTEAISRLKHEGFKKHHQEVEAESQQEAITKLNQLNVENLSALSDFTGSWLFYAVLSIIIFVAVFYAL